MLAVSEYYIFISELKKITDHLNQNVNQNPIMKLPLLCFTQGSHVSSVSPGLDIFILQIICLNDIDLQVQIITVTSKNVFTRTLNNTAVW